MDFLSDARRLVKKNIRDYGMYIALVVIIAVFAILDGNFLSPGNITNLINQYGYIAVMAVAMTLVIVIKHIDLSVGYVAGFLGAVAAIFMTQLGISEILVVPIVLGVGVLVGLFNGSIVAFLKVPAFVVTLAGMLIFKGLLLLVTLKTGTIIIPNKAFNEISNGFIPDIANIPGVHMLTMILGALGIVLFVMSEIKTRRNKMKYNFEVLSPIMLIIKLAFIAAIIIFFTVTLGLKQGFSWTIFVVLIVVAIFHFVTTKMVLGRHIYAVGGNGEAAELGGIKVSKITLIVFGSMGMLSALSGMMYASRLQSATTTAGFGFELDAIAAAFVGGASANGGVGKVTGSIVGALVMGCLSNGMNLVGIDVSIQYVIRGAVLLLAVIFDITTRNRRK